MIIHPKALFSRALSAVFIITLVSTIAFSGGTTTIRGKVTDLEGNPLPGAHVSAVAEGSDSPVTTTTKKRGAFSLKVEDWDRQYQITASLEGYLSTQIPLTLTQDSQVSVNITLAKQGTPASSPPPAQTEGAPSEPAEAQAAVQSEQRSAAIPVFNEGVDALKTGDQATALAKFQQAAELDSDFPEAYRAIAAVAVQVDQYGIAADAAEKLLEYQPDDLDAIGTAYYSELMMGDTARMVVSARRLADANPEIVSGELLQHAIALFDNNRAAQSRALLEVILERQPDLAPAQMQMGMTCNMLGDSECTRTALTRFLELAPDDPNAATAQSLLDYLN